MERLGKISSEQSDNFLTIKGLTTEYFQPLKLYSISEENEKEIFSDIISDKILIWDISQS